MACAGRDSGPAGRSQLVDHPLACLADRVAGLWPQVEPAGARAAKGWYRGGKGCLRAPSAAPFPEYRWREDAMRRASQLSPDD
jgi:hypothetical protein